MVFSWLKAERVFLRSVADDQPMAQFTGILAE